MYKTRSNSGDAMGSLRRDYVARIPIDLNCSPLTSRPIIHQPSQYGTARILVNSPTVVRCRVDSDNSPNVINIDDDDDDDDDQPETYVASQTQPQETTTSGSDVIGRSWSTSGSILKKPEVGGGGGSSSSGGGSQTLSGDRSRQRTPQGRRRVRFTNDVSLYRFDSDGVDSAYSSSECERLYAPIDPVVRRPGTPSNKYPSATVSVPASSQSSVKTYFADDEYHSVPRSGVGRRIQDERRFPPSSPGARQEVRGGQVFHGTPNGSLYLRSDLETAKAMPSAHWTSRTSPTSPKQGPLVVGSSGALRATSYTLVNDHVTQEKKLVVTAKLGDIFHPNDLTIKANKNGSKIRIVSSRPLGHHHYQGPFVATTSRHRILNEQILLPVPVDPYRLTARLDPTGSLLIEAPFAE